MCVKDNEPPEIFVLIPLKTLGDLIALAERSHNYTAGEAWAVNTIVDARRLYCSGKDL